MINNVISDIVYIATININHAELSCMMLPAGKHVLCEKPMTLNLKEANKVLDLAKDKKLFFMEVHIYKYLKVLSNVVHSFL